MSYNSKYKGAEVDAALDLAKSALQEHQDISGLATKVELQGKVDKIDGKQLSTEDFTTLLKERLEGLSNYDDTEIQASVSKLRTDLDTLVSGDTTSAIKTFNEVIAFLDGLEDTEDLASIIASIEKQIAAKQDSISDLATIRDGAAKGATALQSYTETDPTVPEWAKAATKPSYTASEVGALPDTTTIPTKTSQLTNDSGFTGNTGTVTGIKMNGASKGTSGVVDLGNVVIGDGTITKIVKVSSLPANPDATTLYIIPE